MPPLTDALLGAIVAGVGPAQTAPNTQVTPADIQSAIVLRGYLADPQLRGASNVQIWRIYLSARLDVYVDFTAADAVQIAPYLQTSPDGLPGAGIGGAVTLWLNTRAVSAGGNVNPRRYFISRELRTSTGFVSGELLDDFMESHESRAAWPEQEYGSQGWPRTGAASGCH